MIDFFHIVLYTKIYLIFGIFLHYISFLAFGKGRFAVAKLGLQLYTVREEAERDFAGTIRRVAAMGYEGVEFAGGLRKLAAAQDLRRTLDDTALDVAGADFAYQDLREEFGEIASYCATIRCPTVIIPWIDERLRPNPAGWQAVGAGFNAVGAACQAHGLQLLYHVHGFEFAHVAGKTGMEWLAAACDHDLVKLEIDVYWVEQAGVDAVTDTKSHGRVRFVIALKTNGPLRFDLLHAIEAGL